MTHSKQIFNRFLRCSEAAKCPSDCVRTRPSDTQKSGGDVTDPSSIRAAAEKFIQRFGDDACNQANIRADELLQAGNIQGRTRWQLIGKEVAQLMIDSELAKKTTIN
jgi:hypothetical protein